MLEDVRIGPTNGERLETGRDASSSPLIPAKAGTQGHREAVMDARAGSPLSRGRAGGGERSPHNQPTLRSPAAIADTGLIAPARVAELEAVAARYAVAITPAMAELIDVDDPADPIARQFVPDAAELAAMPEENADPIGDGAHEVTPGLIHRYPDRVLLKLVSACAVYCRFCFRRETVGQGEAMSKAELAAALAYIRSRPEIWEVIVSGGDPLVASPRRLRALTAALAKIDHVKVVRFHTRVPVVAPERVTPALVAALKAKAPPHGWRSTPIIRAN
jgi:lysine 2,3-aminomutase